jgi:hypothetical protein
MSTLRNDFLNDAHFFDGTGFGVLAGRYGIEAVLHMAASILQNGAWPEVRHALYFLASLNRGNDLDEPFSSRASRLAPSIVLPALRPLLCTPDHELRRLTGYAMMQLGYLSEARSLRRAMPWFIDHDPIILQSMLSYLSLLGGSTRPWIRQMTFHPSWLVRWASMQPFGDDLLDARENARYERLAIDPHHWVRFVAAHGLERFYLHLESGAAGESRSQSWLRRKRELEQNGPIDLLLAGQRFMAQLAPDQRDYVPDKFMKFVEHNYVRKHFT